MGVGAGPKVLKGPSHANKNQGWCAAWISQRTLPCQKTCLQPRLYINPPSGCRNFSTGQSFGLHWWKTKKNTHGTTAERLCDMRLVTCNIRSPHKENAVGELLWEKRPPLNPPYANSNKDPKVKEKLSRLKVAVSHANFNLAWEFNLDLQNCLQKKGLGGWLAWNSHSRLKFWILEGLILRIFNRFLGP